MPKRKFGTYVLDLISVLPLTAVGLILITTLPLPRWAFLVLYATLLIGSDLALQFFAEILHSNWKARSAAFLLGLVGLLTVFALVR